MQPLPLLQPGRWGLVWAMWESHKRKEPTLDSRGAQAAAAEHTEQAAPACEGRGETLGVQCCPAFLFTAWTRLACLLVPDSSTAGWHAAHLSSACCRCSERWRGQVSSR